MEKLKETETGMEKSKRDVREARETWLDRKCRGRLESAVVGPKET